VVLVWDDSRSFKRHLEAMRAFRHGHDAGNGGFLAMPRTYHIDLPRQEKYLKLLMDDRGNFVIVPIWKIALPAGSRN
jgi:hypothetical protein